MNSGLKVLIFLSIFAISCGDSSPAPPAAEPYGQATATAANSACLSSGQQPQGVGIVGANVLESDARARQPVVSGEIVGRVLNSDPFVFEMLEDQLYGRLLGVSFLHLSDRVIDQLETLKFNDYVRLGVSIFYYDAGGSDTGNGASIGTSVQMIEVLDRQPNLTPFNEAFRQSGILVRYVPDYESTRDPGTIQKVEIFNDGTMVGWFRNGTEVHTLSTAELQIVFESFAASHFDSLESDFSVYPTKQRSLMLACTRWQPVRLGDTVLPIETVIMELAADMRRDP